MLKSFAFILGPTWNGACSSPWAEANMRKASTLLGLVTVAAFALMAERDARACGGCFVPPPPPGEQESVITDHRMILSVSPEQTTLYDQIRYQGNPSSFAWVLPISGEAKVGLSSDTLFRTLDQVTSTVVQAPPLNCPAPPTSCQFGAAGGGDGAQAPSAAADAGTVVVTHEETVGPYETVQLHSTDPNALNDWLASHGYQIPDDVKPIISAYVTAHFDFLALKLVPGAGIQAMRPVRVSTAGAAPVLPLRMVAAGAGATVGITLWVMADGRYETQNFPTFHVADGDLVWDWTTSSSNYKDLRAKNENALAGRGWELESSTSQSQSTIRRYVTNLGRVPVGPDGGQDYLPIQQPDGGGILETPDQVRQDDLDTLFKGIGTSDGQVRVTRLRSDVAHAALADDLVLTASADQSVASNIRQVTKELGEPQCPVYDGQCNQVGTAPRSEAQRAGKESFGCSTTPETASSTLTVFGLAGLFGALAFGSRRRKR